MSRTEKGLTRPLPHVTELTEPFWNATKNKKLVLQYCKSCNEFVWCPRPSCMECGNDDLTWQEVSGQGKIYSFTVIRTIAGRGSKVFEKDIPYVIAWVDLDEGPRFYTNIVGCSIDRIEIGMPVTVIFDPITDEITLPKFTLRLPKV